MNANERKILKIFLLGCSYQFLEDLFELQPITAHDNNSYDINCLADRQIMQAIIHGIVATGEYTLEGIAYYSCIPLDLIVDAACGNNKNFSLSPWAKIIDLFIQVKPEITNLLLDKILEIKNNNTLSLLLKES